MAEATDVAGAPVLAGAASWEPERVARESAMQEQDGDAIAAWDRKIKPPHPDTPPAPSPEADDFEVL